METGVVSSVLAGMLVASALMAAEASPEREEIGADSLSEQVAVLTRQLGDDSPDIRDAAMEKLEQLGTSVLDKMRALAKAEDLEVRTRAQRIVDKIEKELSGYAHCPLSAEEAKARQRKCAEALGVSVEKEVSLGGEVKLVLVLMPAGEFDMGGKVFFNEFPVHRVKIQRPFYMSKYEVTQEQYQHVTAVNKSRFKESPDLPVETVSWDEARSFCKKASEKTGLVLRLPNEAEWEYACRAGTSTDFYAGDARKCLLRVGWSIGNAKNKTHPVGQKEPNAFGLYDMHGNVGEWCEDDLHADYVGAPKDGSVWVEQPRGEKRVVRGGNWRTPFCNCSSSKRAGYRPDTRSVCLGFRLATVLPEEAR